MNLQETVLMQLRDLILRGTFEPGQRLAEQQLAERLGASRTPVRSALVTWAGLRSGLAESINATVPATSGDEKLVPTAASEPPVVYREATGLLTPEFEVDSSG